MLKKWWESRAKMPIEYTDWVGRRNTAVIRVGTQLYNPSSLYGSGILVTGILLKYGKLELNHDTAITRQTLISRLAAGSWFIMP